MAGGGAVRGARAETPTHRGVEDSAPSHLPQYASDQKFIYDDNGNRLNNGYATAQTNTVMGNNRLVSDAAYDYAYDAEGNLTQRVRRIDGRKWDYTWDHRNRLTAVDERLTTGTLVKRVEYAYDALDRRVFKQVDDNGNGTFDRSEHFVYDGEHIVLRYQNGQLANRYVHNPDVVDQVFADEAVSSLLTPGETRWQLTDNQNSVRQIYDYDDATGATVVIDRILYESFGKFWSPTNLASAPLFLYTGREWDPDVNLYYYRARWFDPHSSRFISEDPIYDDYNNPHRYVGNSPTNATDPSGLESFTYLWNLPNSNASRPHWKEVQRAEIRSGKAAINGAATAVKSTVSLGLASDPVELVPLTNDERDSPAYAMDVYGYSLCYELVIGLGVGKVASTPGRFRQLALGWDVASNVSLIGQGAYNGNPTQIGLGLAGLSGNAFGRFGDCSTTAPARTVSRIGDLTAQEQAALRRIWEGGPLSGLHLELRKALAAHYRRVGTSPANPPGSAQRAFQEARARYLLGEGPNPGLNVHEFSRRTGIPIHRRGGGQ
jgi:RHS repeat-associated protein